MRLSELTSGQSALIRDIVGSGAAARRINELGFVAGQKVKAIKSAPLKDPVEYEIMGYKISLRRSDASLVIVELLGVPEPAMANRGSASSMISGYSSPDVPTIRNFADKNTITVALVGNPNCGKTSIFNFATGSKERVANYSGVTVAAREATMLIGKTKINVIDLPGTYSLTPYSPEELFVSDYLIHNKPDFVINVLDAGNLERNLYLTTQILETGHRCIIALNMFDEFTESDRQIDCEKLGALLRMPVIPTVGRDGKGIRELFSKVIQEHNTQNGRGGEIRIPYHSDIESALDLLVEEIAGKCNVSPAPPRLLALKLLQGDIDTPGLLDPACAEKLARLAAEKRASIEKLFNHDINSEFVNVRYGFIKGALSETITSSAGIKAKEKIDPDLLLTHRLMGLPIFFGIIFFIFWATFSLGAYPVAWIDSGISFLSGLLSDLLPDSAATRLIVDGVIGGVGGILVFLPNIVILFLLISLLEDTGYMARTAFLMDRLMHRVGLHGKSFIPLLMGFGCNVPAIMATRNIESKRDRLVTMFIVPFMSCSARLPVYVLFITAFFPGHQALILFGIYAAGIAAALLTAIILNKTVFKSSDTPFVMELPPYRIPTLRAVRSHTWFKTVHFLKKMGTVILFASVIVWALGYFPRNDEIIKRYDTLIAAGANIGSDEDSSLILEKEKELLEQSYVSRIGKFIEPVFEPLGFDWKMSVSLLTGVMAKEVVVSTMSVLYQGTGSDGSPGTLVERLKLDAIQNGTSTVTYFGFLLFTLLYFPCLGTLTAIKHETSRFRYVAFAALYPLLFSWLTVFLVNRVAMLF